MRFAYMLVIAAALAACADKPSKEEQEAAKNTFVCLLDGERLVIRFDLGTARLLMPNGDRISLYQIPTASGVRFSNGNLELRGKGTELILVDNTTATQVPLAQCAPYTAPKQ
jgi:membrane-bound inhibitor of C-type lysozyme